MTSLNSDNYNEIVYSNQIVIVDVKAEWCGPCKAMTQLMYQISSDYTDKIVIGFLDAVIDKDLCTELDIRNIPTLLFYKDGILIHRLIGVKTKKEIVNIINTLLN